MDTIYLVGSEDVRHAGHAMQSAAMEFGRQVANLEGALLRHQQFLDDWLSRLQNTIEQSIEAKDPRP